jgi:hypothetical protein
MSFVYPNARKLAWGGSIDLVANTVKVLLFRPASTCAADVSAKFLADFVDLQETAVTGYSRKTLAGKALNDPGTGPVTFTATDVDFGLLSQGAGESIGGALVFIDNGGAGSDVPLACIDSVAASSISFPYNPNGNQFVLDFVAGVVLQL